jgi:peptidoglycan/LPS O-acetylase OafA/YrhL
MFNEAQVGSDALLDPERPRPIRTRLPRITFQSQAARSTKYRPEIDGLRAVAVLAVLCFHARIPGFSGGFVGVDVFYVISGYLITSIIANDLELGRFSLVSFYDRRIRRIFPALFAVAFFTLTAGAILFAPKDFFALGRSMIAMTFFVTNIFFKREGALEGYFDRTSDLQPLLHTWSLSVEEQFYILFPTTLMLLAHWARGRRFRAIGGLWLLVFISFLVSIWATKYRPQSAFYILVPRAWELLIGALLAMKAVPDLPRRLWREVAGLAGIALIATSIFVFTKETPFPSYRALLPCLGAWLIIHAGSSGPSSVGALLSVRPLVFIGVISYSLYLWHWPIFVMGRYFSAGPLTPLETAAVIISSLVIAFISFEFIESPFRGAASRITRCQVFCFGLAASVLSAACGFAIYWHRGFPERYDVRTEQLLLRNTERKNDFQEVCGNWRKEVHRIADIAFCQVRPNSASKIMFWGDSHVQQLYPLIKKIYDRGDLQNRGVLLAVANGCPPTEHMNTIGAGYHCDSFAKFAMLRASEKDIDTVFMAFNTWWLVHEDVCPSIDGRCVGRTSLDETRSRFLKELSLHVQTLKNAGKRVIVSLPFPMYDKSIPDLSIRNAVFGRFGLGGVAQDISLPVLREEVASVAQEAGADLFDPRASLCPENSCITEIDGVSIYKDDNHLAASQVGILEGDLEEVLYPQRHHSAPTASMPVLEGKAVGEALVICDLSPINLEPKPIRCHIRTSIDLDP